jgi:undecaprenyl-diphosphatase
MNYWKKHLNLFPKNKRFVWFFAGLIFLALFSLLTLEVFKDSRIQTIDQFMLSYVGNNIRHSFLNRTAMGITDLGSPKGIILISLITIIMLSLRRDFNGVFYQILAVSGATILMNILKKSLSRPRPQIIEHLVEATGQSYPSGHALVGSAAFMALAILLCRHIESFNKKVLIYFTALLIVILIAFSRVYLGVHYPSDVIGGMLLGTSWVLLLGAFLKVNSFSNQQR